MSTESTAKGREQIARLIESYTDSDWLEVHDTPLNGGRIGCVTLISNRDDFPFTLMHGLFPGEEYDRLRLYHAGRTSEEDGHRPWLRLVG